MEMNRFYLWTVISAVVIVLALILAFIFRSNPEAIIKLQIGVVAYQIFLAVKVLRWLYE